MFHFFSLSCYKDNLTDMFVTSGVYLNTRSFHHTILINTITIAILNTPQIQTNLKTFRHVKLQYFYTYLILVSGSPHHCHPWHHEEYETEQWCQSAMDCNNPTFSNHRSSHLLFISSTGQFISCITYPPFQHKKSEVHFQDFCTSLFAYFING